MANYDSTSPYYTTGYTQFYLSPMVNRPIPKLPDDRQMVINQTYQYRPDMLAFDLYVWIGKDGRQWLEAR
jgi:hypothetical protein